MTDLLILDRAHLAAMTGGDTGLTIEVLEIFREQAALWGRMLDPKAPPAQWADAAHTLKGASLGIGAFELAAACATAEESGRAEVAPSRALAAVRLGDVKDALARALDAVATAQSDLA